MTADEHPELGVVVRVPSEFEAHTIAAILHDSGIEATVAPGAPSWTGQVALSPAAQGSAAVVSTAGLQRARTVLRDCHPPSTDLAWVAVDAGARHDNLPPHPVARLPTPPHLAAASPAAD